VTKSTWQAGLTTRRRKPRLRTGRRDVARTIMLQPATILWIGSLHEVVECQTRAMVQDQAHDGWSYIYRIAWGRFQGSIAKVEAREI
jgi:hypothetical protein